jgi:hypothetical protein
MDFALLRRTWRCDFRDPLVLAVEALGESVQKVEDASVLGSCLQLDERPRPIDINIEQITRA